MFCGLDVDDVRTTGIFEIDGVYVVIISMDRVQTLQLSLFHHETHGFGPLLTVSQSISDFSLSVLKSHGDSRKLVPQLQII